MATWPSTLEYQTDGHGWTNEPVVQRTEFSSGNTRQRLVMLNRDDLFTATLQCDETQLAVFETFVLDTLNNGADTYTGPYYVSDTEYTGTIEIVDGQYSVEYLAEDLWSVQFSFYVKERDLTNEELLYELVNELSGFNGLYELIPVTEDAVNNNNL